MLMVWFSDPSYYKEKCDELSEDYQELETFLFKLNDGMSY